VKNDACDVTVAINTAAAGEGNGDRLLRAAQDAV